MEYVGCMTMLATGEVVLFIARWLCAGRQNSHPSQPFSLNCFDLVTWVPSNPTSDLGPSDFRSETLPIHGT